MRIVNFGKDKRPDYDKLSAGRGAHQVVRRTGAFREPFARRRRGPAHRADREKRNGQDDAAEHSRRKRRLRGRAHYAETRPENRLFGAGPEASGGQDRARRLPHGRLAGPARDRGLRTGARLGRRGESAPGHGRNGCPAGMELRIAGQADSHPAAYHRLRPADRAAVGRTSQARGACRRADSRAGAADSGRTDEPPRPRVRPDGSRITSPARG